MTTHVTTVMDAISALTPMLIAGLLAISARWSLRRIR